MVVTAGVERIMQTAAKQDANTAWRHWRSHRDTTTFHCELQAVSSASQQNENSGARTEERKNT